LQNRFGNLMARPRLMLLRTSDGSIPASCGF
jgi:hypothetical protein